MMLLRMSVIGMKFRIPMQLVFIDLVIGMNDTIDSIVHH